MTAKLSDEQRQALRQQPDRPLEVQDDETQKVYVLVDRTTLPTLWEDYIRRELKVGFDAIDRGDVADLDIEATIAEAKHRHSKQAG